MISCVSICQDLSEAAHESVPEPEPAPEVPPVMVSTREASPTSAHAPSLLFPHLLEVEEAIRAWMEEQAQGPQHPAPQPTGDMEFAASILPGEERPHFAEEHYGEWLKQHVPMNRSAPSSAVQRNPSESVRLDGAKAARPRTAGDWRCAP